MKFKGGKNRKATSFGFTLRLGINQINYKSKKVNLGLHNSNGSTFGSFSSDAFSPRATTH